MSKRRRKRPAGSRRARSLGLELPGWRLADLDAGTGNAVWVRDIWSGAAPVGEPGGRDRRGSAGRYIRPAIEDIDPYRALELIRALPAELRRARASNFAFQLDYSTRDSAHQQLTGPAFYNVESISRPTILGQMAADVLIRAAQRHGYAGAVTALAVRLVMSCAAGALPARKGRRRPPPVAARPLSEKLRSLDPRSLRYGKRQRRGGKYYQPVYDQHGRLRGRLRWYSGVRADLRGLLELTRQLRAADVAAEGWE